MNENFPDYWTIVKITDLVKGVHHYRVLCSWVGSYLYGTSWQLSSGIIDVEDCGTRWRLPQTSGSVYLLNKDSEHMNGLMHSTFERLKSGEDDVAKIEALKFSDFLAEWKQSS